MPSAADDIHSDLPLAADFPPATADDWRKLVDGVLKGTPFETLVAKTYDDLAIEPIYARARRPRRCNALAGDAADRSSRPGAGQRAGPARA
jgi:methylmalonyl-CoA mutase